PSKSPSKARSLSDSTPRLSPSPNIKESIRKSKDDHTIETNPKTPRRPDFLARGLSLQMPSKQGSPSTGLLPSRGPLSPKLDSRNIYSSPASVLPRHSRGLDFSRACTNLHHSTVAEQSSPDSSPTITQKAIAIPPRSSLSHSSMILDSPQMNSGAWTHAGNKDKSMASGSVSSINMLDSSSSDSDGGDPMEGDDNDDLMISTPQAYKLNDASAPTPFAAAPTTRLWPGPGIAAPSSFMSFQRARLRHRRSRHSSSSASGHSSLASPIPQSPPNGRADGNSYFAREITRKAASRRESLSLGTSDLHISSGNDSGDEAGQSGVSTPGVVQRPVTRRTNMLPKSRAFGRIRAELIEESSPVDTEVRREAQVVRQVRESDLNIDQPQQGGESSPILPAAPDGLDDIPEGNPLGTNVPGAPKGLFGAFSRQAFKNSISGGKDFWNNFDNQIRTPPPPFFPRAGSSTVSDDINMDSPTTSLPQPQEQAKENNVGLSLSRASTPQPPAPPPSAAEGIRKNNKRRRDDDLDGMSIKRRAVSPGMSVQNSPILSQSPGNRETNLWGQPHSQSQAKASREGSVTGHAAGQRSDSTGSQASVVPAIGPLGKRIGMQGMTDTNDGLMKMSIE
ncbi:hypothetical protein NA57DRAFT_24547, partial [Rhizodiscina lignyota]